jgi:hypothetical protein
MDDSELPSASFYRYQRSSLARGLARKAILERLPEPLAEVAAFFDKLAAME